MYTDTTTSIYQSRYVRSLRDVRVHRYLCARIRKSVADKKINSQQVELNLRQGIEIHRLRIIRTREIACNAYRYVYDTYSAKSYTMDYLAKFLSKKITTLEHLQCLNLNICNVNFCGLRLCNDIPHLHFPFPI